VVLAIDALSFRSRGSADEASRKSIDRELEKARIALKIPATGEFATGNWGAGAFCGDPQLKAIIQWLASSVNGVKMRHYPFGDTRISGLRAFVDAAIARKWTVGQVYKALLEAPAHTFSKQGYLQYLLGKL
jgi:hypothetical protein